MKKVLITGIAGMVGSHLTDYILENTDWEVYGFCRWNDNLENIAVYNHVTSNIYNGDFEAYKIFLSGEFKWYYIDKIFFPINIFHLIFNDKQYFFLIEILQSVIAYFSFYLFSKSFLKNKSHAIWGAILYFTSTNLVVAPEDSPTIFLSFLPYILYLGIIKKNLNIKHLIIIFFIGSLA